MLVLWLLHHPLLNQLELAKESYSTFQGAPVAPICWQINLKTMPYVLVLTVLFL